MRKTTRKKHKFSLTLIEVMIALVLTGILMSFLWQAYFGLQKQLYKIEEKKAESLASVAFQERVSKLISWVSKEDPLLYTVENRHEPKMLIFKAEMPVDPDPDFSGPLLCGLYLSENSELCITEWASEDKVRSEVLMEKVSSFDTYFYEEKKKTWQPSWPENSKSMPVMIRCKVSKGSTTSEYYFFPSQHLGPIIYPKPKV
jgi:type II secretory pathway pseudopilin PulG